jgi:hypothetical protein
MAQSAKDLLIDGFVQATGVTPWSCHPLVHRIAKPYCRDGKNRKKHRECEVFQDYFLYEEVYRAERQKRKGRTPDE